MRPAIVNSESFEHEVLQSAQLTIVDFWAPWCGPCKMIAPILDEFASRYGGEVKVTKLNVDENPEMAQRFGITSIPTLLFFRGGQIVDRLIGAASKSLLDIRIRRLLSISVSVEAR